MNRLQTIQQQSPIGKLLLMTATLLFNLSISGSGLAKDTSDVQVKDYFSNVELTTQKTARMKLFDDISRDKIVSINFIVARKGDRNDDDRHHNHDNNGHNHDGRHDDHNHNERYDDRSHDGRHDDQHHHDDHNSHKSNRDRS